jgi:hypothetical protein
LNQHYTGISKIIPVKGGHGLENVRLNLFSVTISSVRTIGLPAPFLWVTVSFAKHTNTICKNPSTLLQSMGKNKTMTDLDIQKMIDTNASTIIWKSMTTSDQDNFWYPGTSWRNFVEWKYIQGYHFKCALHCSCLWNLPITVLSVSVVYYKN